MGKYPSSFKQYILQQYTPYQYGNGFKSLANRYNIAGGGRTVKNWYDRWDNTEISLKRKQGSGRTTILNERKIKTHVLNKIKNKNKEIKTIHYSDLKKSIEKKTNKSISLRTIQRYGKDRMGIKNVTKNKKTTKECKYTQISNLTKYKYLLFYIHLSNNNCFSVFL